MNSREILDIILSLAIDKWYSDIHLNSNHYPIIRDEMWDIVKVDSVWEREIPILSKENLLEIIKIISWDYWLNRFLKDFEFDWSYSSNNWVRYRINCYIDTNWYSISLRSISTKIPWLTDLWFNEDIEAMCKKSKWLILVTWPTWAWKSTNMAAMIEYINQNLKKHIITIEDPVEFAFKSKKSLVNQREIWNTTKWFWEAIRWALREDPDVVMVWEMRDPETIKAALVLAETWHLVISTLHTNDSVQTIDRIVDIFPSTQQKQIRIMLAMTLVWVIAQRLLPRADWKWRVAAREILITNDAIRNLIISWRTHLLYWVLEVWKSSGMILMDKYLTILYKKWVITKDTLLSYIRDKDWIDMLLKNENKDEK